MKTTARLLIAGLFFVLALAACAPAPTQAPNPSAAPATVAPTIPATSQPSVQPTPIPTVEQRMVELEWPAALRLGESDLVRLSLVPYAGGYEVKAEFPEHAVQSQPVKVTRVAGFVLSGIARLDGVGFEISPGSEQEQSLSPDETVTWRWTLQGRAPGQQRLSIQLVLRWTPEAGNNAAPRQTLAFSRGLDVQVSSFLGLSQSQALGTGFISLLAGLGLSLGAAVILRPAGSRKVRLKVAAPNLKLELEPYPGMQLSSEESNLLKSLFGRYSRLALESEFLSGYSGARTFLARPVRADGRADAETIVKISWREDIEREAANYEAFVKDSLPPMTARIQHAPVTQAGSRRAAVQYTFIAEPGRPPVSLRQALLANPDPAPLNRLFDTFGPGWWMQRRAAAFRLSQEYDCLLPPHLVLEPTNQGGYPLKTISETSPAYDSGLAIGDLVAVGRFGTVEPRADGCSFTLLGRALPGQPPLRVRWLNETLPGRQAARVVATRQSMFAGWTAGLERFGLPDPLERLPGWLNEVMQGSQSIIHGDLNLENVLVGPGGFVWLIDFARTREGHPLFDFAHLEAEIIAHILLPGISSPGDYVDALAAGRLPLLVAMEQIAGRCLFNPNQPREYRLSLALACLGALKYPNLDQKARHLLYLTAAYQGLASS
jgi:hypothetical protein